VARRCEALGITLSGDELDQAYHAVIAMGEHRKSIGDNDLKRIVERLRNGSGVAPAAPVHPNEAVGYGHGV
jgi:hypothetical protein